MVSPDFINETLNIMNVPIDILNIMNVPIDIPIDIS